MIWPGNCRTTKPVLTAILNSNWDIDENWFKMAAILKSKMVSVGMILEDAIFFITMCIIQFPCIFVYVDLSSLYLKEAKKAWKYH